jgi:hypothetical protein
VNTNEEVEFWQKARELIKEGYGGCPKEDMDEDSEKNCISCRASLVMEFIDDHIRMLK